MAAATKPLPPLSSLLADSDDEDSGGGSSSDGKALAMIEKLRLQLDAQGSQLAEELEGMCGAHGKAYMTVHL